MFFSCEQIVTKREYIYISYDGHFKSFRPLTVKFHEVLCNTFIIVYPGRVPLGVVELALLNMFKVVKTITDRHQASDSNTSLYIVQLPYVLSFYNI